MLTQITMKNRFFSLCVHVCAHDECSMWDLLKNDLKNTSTFIFYLRITHSPNSPTLLCSRPFLSLFYTRTIFFLFAICHTCAEIFFSFYSLNWLLSLHKQKSQMKRDECSTHTQWKKEEKKKKRQKEKRMNRKEGDFLCFLSSSSYIEIDR